VAAAEIIERQRKIKRDDMSTEFVVRFACNLYKNGLINPSTPQPATLIIIVINSPEVKASK